MKINAPDSDRLTRAVACALAAARAIDAIRLWRDQLTPQECEKVRRRLRLMTEHDAANLWENSSQNTL